MLRRTYDSLPNQSHGTPRSYPQHQYATLTYNGEQIDLTFNEYKIPKCSWKTVETWSQGSTDDHALETDSYVDDNTLTVNVTSFAKLEAVGLAEFITTKKGMGYEVEE